MQVGILAKRRMALRRCAGVGDVAGLRVSMPRKDTGRANGVHRVGAAREVGDGPVEGFADRPLGGLGFLERGELRLVRQFAVPQR
jgi:hypothetical protein